MPSVHRLTAKQTIHPRQLVGEIFIAGSNKGTVLRAVTEDYPRRSGVDIKFNHGAWTIWRWPCPWPPRGGSR
jgi:LysR family transcriptional regulator, hca operon transcriptional activator